MPQPGLARSRENPPALWIVLNQLVDLTSEFVVENQGKVG